MNIWILAETRGGALKRVSLELIGAARALDASAQVSAILVGSGVAGLAGDLAARGADEVLVADDARLTAFSPDGWAALVAGWLGDRKPDVFLAPSTSRGRDLVPRVAAILGVGVASDAVALSLDGGRVVALRPIYAGKALARVRVKTNPQIVTLRPNSYPPLAQAGAGKVETLGIGDYAPQATVSAMEVTQSARPDVSEADIIVSGGRGMGGPEHFHLIEELADALGGATGASRAVVDAGWRPHSEQVGQTGKTVSPSLYIACGISGAVQHLAGMKTAKVIVAINKDREAPMISLADYAIVGDLFQVLPALTAAVKAHKAEAR